MIVLDTGISSAEENMRLDGQLLEELDPNGESLLHFYGWEGLAATYGYFENPSLFVDLEKAKARGLSLARRPTGGGIVFHIWDLAFSFLMPSGHSEFSLNPLENYKFVNQIVLEVMKDFFDLKTPVELTVEKTEPLHKDCTHFCMAKPTQYDVVYQGMKIAGAAQRRRKQGYLHQGTISLSFPDLDFLKEVLLSQDAVITAMNGYTFAPLGQKGSSTELQKTRFEIQSRLQQKFIEKLQKTPYNSSL